MDTFTHIAIGACIGEAFFEKGFGKKAMLWGALAHSIPDIDFVSNLWLSDAEALLAHRGFTHSFFFMAFAVPLFAMTAEKFHRIEQVRLRKWLLFFGVEMLIHLLLDSMNSYGIGWLEPFSHHRFAFNLLYVLDPFFSFFSLVACVLLFWMRKDDPRRSFWWKAGILSVCIYTVFSFYNKFIIDNTIVAALEQKRIRPKRFFTTPAPLQNFLWYIVVETDQGYYTAYKSVLEKNKTVTFNFTQKQYQLARLISDHEEFQHLIRFSDNYYTIDSTDGKLIFSDLRFGQRIGWMHPDDKFVFQFDLKHQSDNQLVIQRGRLYGWNAATLLSYFRRVFQN